MATKPMCCSAGDAGCAVRSMCKTPAAIQGKALPLPLVEVAGDLVAGGHLDQRWLGRSTLGHGEGTTGMEVAA